MRGELERRMQYPRELRRRGAAGTAVLALTLARSGVLVASSVTESSGWTALDRAALNAARVGRFQTAPAQLKGQQFRFRIPLSFQLK